MAYRCFLEFLGLHAFHFYGGSKNIQIGCPISTAPAARLTTSLRFLSPSLATSELMSVRSLRCSSSVIWKRLISVSFLGVYSGGSSRPPNDTFPRQEKEKDRHLHMGLFSLWIGLLKTEFHPILYLIYGRSLLSRLRDLSNKGPGSMSISVHFDYRSFFDPFISIISIFFERYKDHINLSSRWLIFIHIRSQDVQIFGSFSGYFLYQALSVRRTIH